MGGGRAVQVFLSYRRGDVPGHAGRLADALRQRLGTDSVFQDVVAIAPGQDFTAAIDRALDDCDAVLAVIGPSWLTAATPQGAPRLFQADDYVRLELARALDRNVRVIPVLVGGAALPAAGELPDELKGLVRRQAVVLHDETWHQDVNGLVGSLRGEPAVPTTRRPRWLVPGAAVAVVLVVGAAVWWWGAGSGGGSGGGQQPEPPKCAAPAAGERWSRITLNDNPTGEEQRPEGSLLFTVRDARWRASGGGWQVVLTTRMQNKTSAPQYHGSWRYQYLVVGQQAFKEVTCFSSAPGTVDPQLVDEALIGFQVRCKPVGAIDVMLEDNKGRIRVTKDSKPGAC
jgi:hypothetical protein